jgi:hypothetical protein
MREASISLLLALMSVSSLAFAEDRCSDVLQSGTLQSTNVRHNQYIQQIIQTRFLSSTFQQSKSDTSAGFGAALGSYFFQGDYNEAQFNQKKAELRREAFKEVSIKDELDVALTSGDPTIINAWRGCMATRNINGWLELTFIPRSGTQIFGTVIWHPGQAGQSPVNTKLVEEIVIDKATVLSGKNCLKEGAVITATGCKFSIRAETAKQTLAAIANAADGSAEAYVPPRMLLIKESRPFVFADHLAQEWARTPTGTPATIVTLSEQNVADGWSFDPGSAKIALSKRTQRWVHDCLEEHISADLYSVSYGYKVSMSDRTRDDRAAHITCSVNPSIAMVRHKWITMD